MVGIYKIIGENNYLKEYNKGDNNEKLV